MSDGGIIDLERDSQGGVRLAELLAAMSLGIDLGLGQPMEHVIRSTLIAMRLGDSIGLGPQERAVLYQVSLVAWVGCGADSHEAARWFGDDIRFRADSYSRDLAGLPLVTFLARRVGAGRGPVDRVRTAAAFLAGGAEAMMRTHCVTAGRFAERLSLDPEVARSLRLMFERWDGKGPEGLRGEAIPTPVRIVQLADIGAAFHRAGGQDAAVAVARERSGAQFDPSLVDAFCRNAGGILAELGQLDTWQVVIHAEPGLREPLDDRRLDDALEAMADFTDVKSPYTMGHARGTAQLAEAAGRHAGLPDAEVQTLRRAALLQDVGRMGVSNAILDKPGPLTASQTEHLRLHPYFSERMLARPAALARIGALAALHHERLDGSGYPRGLAAAALGTAARVLAAADVYHALTQERPHRPAQDAEQATAVLREEVKAGRLDGMAVDAVLKAAGHRIRRRREWPAGLTPREVEILALVARGLSSRDIAARLSIAPKTVGNHVEHIYTKIGSTNRAEAGLFAMRHGLLELSPDG